MMNKIWIRRDRETGKEEEVSETYAKTRLVGLYSRINQAMKAASKNTPLTTGFADYWPKEDENNAKS